jgi:uncharacterized membrane protein
MTMQMERESTTTNQARIDVEPRPAFQQRGRRRGDPDPDGGLGLARVLGWVSEGLGVAALARPRALARFTGLRDDGRNEMILRLAGARELAKGLGILSRARPTSWVWARVAGDAMDLSLVGYELISGRARKRGRAMATLGALIGIAAVDALCAVRLSNGSRQPSRRADGRQVITVGKPPEEVYRFWRDFQNFPRFMHYVESVQVTGETTSHWRAKAPVGTVEWDAEIIADRPNELIGWRSLIGSEVDNSGWVRFRSAPGGRGTEIVVELRYEPPAGWAGRAVAKLTGRDPLQEAHDDLRRLKQVLETGEPMLSDATIDGAGMPQRPARPPEQAPRPFTRSA